MIYRLAFITVAALAFIAIFAPAEAAPIRVATHHSGMRLVLHDTPCERHKERGRVEMRGPSDQILRVGCYVTREDPAQVEIEWDDGRVNFAPMSIFGVAM